MVVLAGPNGAGKSTLYQNVIATRISALSSTPTSSSAMN